MPRFHCHLPLAVGTNIDLPSGAARHVQVLRMQPGEQVTLFEGQPDAGEWLATITHMGRSNVHVHVDAHIVVERESHRSVHLLVGITANERMDWLVEKATELGVASITPLLAERSVLKLKGERANKKRAHWQAIAVAACEQCGRNQIPVVHDAITLTHWVQHHVASLKVTQRLMLSLTQGAQPLRQHTLVKDKEHPVFFLSGPEGGLTIAEETLAHDAGFLPVTLGPRVLRAETAPLAALAVLDLAF